MKASRASKEHGVASMRAGDHCPCVHPHLVQAAAPVVLVFLLL